MSLNESPKASRLHIAILGRTNSGKSTLLNAITKQDVSLVSTQKGTTTDIVYKAMELHGIGPVMFLDTAGFDDETSLGNARIEKTKSAIAQADIAIVLFHDANIEVELSYLELLKEAKIPCLKLYHAFDNYNYVQQINKQLNEELLVINAKDENITEVIRSQILHLMPQDFNDDHIVWHLVNEDDVVMLVMPQDIQAPKGRLILAQVQTIRDLLDRKCIVQCVTTDKLKQGLNALKQPPKLIICDSQVFQEVYQVKPEASLLTSFSVLLAKHKGDINYFVESAKAIDALKANSKVLIAEACTHAPMQEDIGRVKIPMMLRKLKGESLQFEIVSGMNFPDDLSSYDLIIHCGACMFNRKYVLNRVEQAKKANIPMCNYGITIAYLKNILEYVVY